MNAETSPPLRPRRPEVATILSFLWPGLGQWYGGRREAAAAFAIPIGVVVGLGLGALLADTQRFALKLFQPGLALVVLVLILAAGAIRLASMVDALRLPDAGRPPRGRPLALFGLLAVLVVGSHLGLASIAWGFHSAAGRIFIDDPIAALPTPSPTPTPVPTPTGSGPVEPTPSPTIAPPERINVLLTGIDSASFRRTLLTDTLIVVSIDPVSKDVAMISFPRDIARFPLWDGRRYTGKINELYAHARRNPNEFPDGPMGTLARELGYLIGAPIDYYAAINLEGFERMIDAVGGVTINNERAIDDPAYGGWRDGRVGFFLSAGRHKLDGPTALAYARSRKGAGDNDFTRARRQQQLLVALQAKLTDPAMLPRLNDILDAAANTIQTNFPPDQLSAMLELGRGVDDKAIDRFVLGPPYATHPPTSSTGGVYTLALDLDKIATLSMELFGSASRYAQQLGAP